MHSRIKEDGRGKLFSSHWIVLLIAFCTLLLLPTTAQMLTQYKVKRLMTYDTRQKKRKEKKKH